MINTDGITIRIAQNGDFDIIYQIWLDGVDNSFDKNLIAPELLYERFKTNFDNRNGIFNFWIAEKGGTILGWQSLIKTSYNPFRQDSYAESSTYISKDCRFKGIGELLIAHVLKLAEQSELEYVMGYVSVENLVARKMTAKTGWIEIGKIPPSLKNKNAKEKILLIRPV